MIKFRWFFHCKPWWSLSLVVFCRLPGDRNCRSALQGACGHCSKQSRTCTRCPEALLSSCSCNSASGPSAWVPTWFLLLSLRFPCGRARLRAPQHLVPSLRFLPFSPADFSWVKHILTYSKRNTATGRPRNHRIACIPCTCCHLRPGGCSYSFPK